ncbi:hypothetical protein GGR03_000674 [Aurantimonas endophytica]|uniref:Uncharacterized protein n=2 Tax=Aurantimonas endophytica TaxID=1522175 RepID=A0A7W6HAR8_9HYPH|nr:hypothetical protein [Aurantimonas endophytica]MBB4001627.1 hypothetical protein [Aurantimonas endophytica]
MPRAQKGRSSVQYDVRLTDWRWEYGFSVGAPLGHGLPLEPYFDNREIELFGAPIRPSGLKAEAAKIRLSFIVDLKEMIGRTPPPTIGELYLRNGLLQAYVFMPTDVLPSMLVMLTADRFKRVSILAPKLHYRTSQIQGFHFHRNIEDAIVD